MFRRYFGRYFYVFVVVGRALFLAARAEVFAAGANLAAESLLDSHRVFRGDDWRHVY